ncbi:MAG: glutaminyl-peptide cyclotransferase [Trueperaceae bacterium]|nr:glutaminyl-peptide cyclotransferase [Trueperaceae bacterium]
MRAAATLLASALLLAGCTPPPADALPYEVVARYPHDPAAFTQGLLWHDGALFESTGLYGASSLRRVRLDDGARQAVRYLPDDVFAEGLARVGDELIQLTWKRGEAYRWPLDGFEAAPGPRRVHTYAGEGWGLCFDGERLVMSDGSATLTFRDPDTFAVEGRREVRLDGEPLARLNELACVGDRVWANVWYDDRLVRIDPASGRVDGYLDLRGLLADEERSTLADDAVLNGVAWRPEAGTFLVTGKRWPALFELRVGE